MSDKDSVIVEPRDPELDQAKRLTDSGFIGEGGMCVVRKAYDNNLKKTVALKKLKPELIENDVMRRRLIEEAQITAQLDHQNIVPVHEMGMIDDKELYFTMKFVKGSKTLTRLLYEQDYELRTEQELFKQLKIFIKICEAVSFAHKRGVIHRDIKSDNIMVGEEGEVYLVDWGIAKLTRELHERKKRAEKEGVYSAHTREGTVIGTPSYMAPERVLADDENIDERSDIFSLGAILYEILTKQPPYTSDNSLELRTMAALGEVTPPDEAVDLELPERLCGICMKALERKPDDRFASVDDLMHETEAFMRSGWQFRRQIYPAGAIIVAEGEAGDSAYVIESGHCRVFKTVRGEKVVLSVMGPKEVFGEIAVLTEEPRTASVEAIDEVRLRVVTRKHFEQALGAESWEMLFLNTLAERFSKMNREVSEYKIKLKEAQLTSEILKSLNVCGGEGKGEVSFETNWSALCEKLAKQFNRSNEEIHHLVDQTHLFVINPAKDIISLAEF